MKKKDIRTNRILTILTEEEKTEVSALSKRLDVSQVTIRKDLDSLESAGLIVREHGFARLSSTNDIAGRLAYHYEEKKKIAAKAAELVREGSCIMIENGSVCALLADTLSETKKDLTIITNSAFIASYIRKKAAFRIVLLGGIYQTDSQVMVGPMIRKCAENFLADTLFIGVDGCSDQGFTNQDELRAEAVLDMAVRAEKVIVLTESEKFSRRGAVPMPLDERLTAVITDRNIPDTVREKLKCKGIETIVV